MISEDDIRRALKQVPLFSDIQSKTLDRLTDLATVRTEEAGTILFKEGDPGTEFLAILSGSLRLVTRTEDLDALTLRVLVAGDFLGEMALIDHFPRSATAEILETARLVSIDRDGFRALVHEEPDIAFSLLRCMAGWLREITEDVTNIAYLDVYTRMAKKLLHLAAAHGSKIDGGIRIDTPLPLAVLSTMIGSDPDGVHHLIVLLENMGVLSHQADHIILHDLDRLHEPLLATRV